MPTVGKKKFPYTAAGMKDAKAAVKKASTKKVVAKKVSDKSPTPSKRKTRISSSGPSEVTWSGGLSSMPGSSIGGRDKGYYDADNKAISASRGRAIRQDTKDNKRYLGVGNLTANQMALDSVNRKEDRTIRPGAVRRQGSKAIDKAYDALDKPIKYSRSAVAEQKRLTKAKQRGDLGRGSYASQEASRPTTTRKRKK